MIALYVAAGVLIFVAGAFLLQRKGRAVVDNCVIWVSQDTHCTALVYYRDGRQVMRFGAEVAYPKEGGRFLYIDLPYKMYTDDGHLVPNDEAAVIKQRLSRGLKQLGVSHEFSSVESASGNSLIQ